MEKDIPVGFHVVLQWGWVGLSQPVDVDDGAQVVQLVEAREVDGLPDVAFGRLTISHLEK